MSADKFLVYWLDEKRWSIVSETAIKGWNKNIGAQTETKFQGQFYKSSIIANLAYVGESRYGVKMPRNILQRAEKTAKTAEKLALNLIEFLLSNEEIQTVTVYGNPQHGKHSMDEDKRKALRSHIFSCYRQDADKAQGAWEKIVKGLNDKIRKLRTGIYKHKQCSK